MPHKEEGNAILWDFDGTLVDTRRKNLNVTRAIVEAVTGRRSDTIEALTSLATYAGAIARATNWRDLYADAFGLTGPDIDAAGRLWTEYQLRDATATPVFDGIAEVLDGLHQWPHGIVSQNGKANIKAILEAGDLAHYFGAIVGYEEVEFGKQKPAPEGLFRCLQVLTHLKPGYVFYIGDHETDTLSAARAKEVVKQGDVAIEFISIGALYGATVSDPSWEVMPDYIAREPMDIVDIVECCMTR
ncbi:MAG: HAD family hydrolase [Rhodothermales bacterium]